MVRSKGDKNFTDSEKKLLISLIRDYEVCDLPDYTMMDILSKKLGRSIKETSYYMLKNEANKNKLPPEEWLDNFVRFGLVDFYNKRIQEVNLVQKELMKLYAQEANKKEDEKDRNKQNKQLMNQLAKTINDNSKIMSEIAVGPATIAKLLSLIPKQLIEDPEYLENHFKNMDKNKRFFWPGGSNANEGSDDKEEEIKLDPSKESTALLPSIDGVVNNNKSNKANISEEGTAQQQEEEEEDPQRVF